MVTLKMHDAYVRWFQPLERLSLLCLSHSGLSNRNGAAKTDTANAKITYSCLPHI